MTGKQLLGGAFGGLLGAVVWAAIVYSTGMPIPWAAWGVGILAGLGMVAAGVHSTSNSRAFAAAAIALAALLGGKFAVAHLLARDAMTSVPLVTDELLISRVAAGVVRDYRVSGLSIRFPATADLESPDSEADYPAGIWAAATRRWNDLGSAKQAERRAAAIEEREAAAAAAFTSALGAGFTLIDVLWMGLAVGSSFALGLGAHVKPSIVGGLDMTADKPTLETPVRFLPALAPPAPGPSLRPSEPGTEPKADEAA